MKNSIRIPVALQIRIDDVGWHYGRDQRGVGLPSRTGIPRYHCPEDYTTIAELGKALDMKIGCSLVVGDWDKDNLLRGIPHLTPYEKDWDQASKMDMDYFTRSFEILNGSPFLDFILHGIWHGYYENGEQVTEQQYYPKVWDKETGKYKDAFQKLPLDEFRLHLDMFYKILDSWGFTKKATAFASPCGPVGVPADNSDYMKILREYGILSWKNIWGEWDDYAGVQDGIVCEQAVALIPWEGYDIDPRYLKDAIKEDDPNPRTDFLTHWPNFLRYNPENNGERLSAWVDYFQRQAEIFGIMLSKDIHFAASQAVYNRFGKTDFAEGKCIIDLTDADKQNAAALKNEFYVSFKNGTVPVTCEGGALSVYETKKNFVTYKIERTGGDKVQIGF